MLVGRLKGPSHAARHRDSAAFALLMIICMPMISGAYAQNLTPFASQPPQQSSQQTQQTVPSLSTTVVVHGTTVDNYLPQAITVGTLSGSTPLEMPLSVTAVTRELLDDQQARLLSDVVKNDASVTDDYVPVGYYGDYQIRGFPIDLATGLEINGMTIAGEQDVPLENKESVEILKGIASVESGVASAGGLIDYVTKQPIDIQAFDLATDHRGTAYGTVDIGHLYGAQKQVGVRVNLAGERIVTYMNDTNGWRGVGAGAADWKLNASTMLKGDFEYQHKTERDGSGYQLLGGTTLPDIHRIYRSTLLGDQSWAPPDTYDVFNTGARIEHTFSPSWVAFAAASLSHSLIQDNVIYAYGTPFDSNGNVACPGATDAPAYFFCPDGSYGIYDYRNPGELRIDSEAEAMVTGHIHTGAVTQDIAAGGVLFLRSVQEPGAPPAGAPSTVQDGAVYAYVGAENIYQPIAPVAQESPLQSAGPRTLWEDSHQSAGVIQDRIHLPARFQVIAGGRYDSLRDHNYSAGSILPSKLIWLPQYALMWNATGALTVYSNYGVMLSLGPQGPWWVDNANQILAPFNTRQTEVGVKYEPDHSILLTAALFHMRAPFFYSKVLPAADTFCPAGNPGDLCFESEGRETHNGIELAAEGKAANWLRLDGSATAMNAISSDTGTLSYDSKQVINVPHLRTNLFADVTVPHFRGLHIMPGWSYTSRKEATSDDAVSVPSYNVLNLGASYAPGGEQGHLVFHLFANNVTDKLYWSDTGASYGDSFVWLGAPTTVRLDAHYTF